MLRKTTPVKNSRIYLAAKKALNLLEGHLTDNWPKEEWKDTIYYEAYYELKVAVGEFDEYDHSSITMQRGK